MKRISSVFLSCIIAIAVVGYFVGIADGVPQPEGMQQTAFIAQADRNTLDANAKLVPAVTYNEVPSTAMGPTKSWQAEPQIIEPPTYDLYEKITPSEEEKIASSKIRASRRAFNGAPPIIPHAVENTNDAACYACHAGGVRLTGFHASVMSHGFLSNCTQCHAPIAPAPFQHLDATVESGFVGLPAPQQGHRAYPGAPPTIPHSRWMRERCNACHGGSQGWAGMESTHPWRTNCTQCHAPSATLDQMPDTEAVPMLPGLEIVANSVE